MATLDLPYKPKILPTFFALLFFAAMAAFMGHEALTNNRGLNISGLVTLSVTGATIFFWCLSALAGAFVLLGIPAFAMMFVRRHRVTLTETTLASPRYGWSKQPTVVALTDIRSLTLQEVYKKRFLNVEHAHGKLTINEQFLPDRAAFEQLCSELAKHVPRVAPRARP